MHASDEEREAELQNWNINNHDGKEIVQHIASIFTAECVYKITDTRATVKNGKWVIETFSDNENYTKLKNRKGIGFLGFDIIFSHIDEL
jgi:hypothetical protein